MTKVAEPDLPRPVQVALVNDYEVIIAGLRSMLAPYRTQIEVVELDVDEDPGRPVDIALFDTFGQPGMGLRRVRELVRDPNVGALVVYTWELVPTSRDEVLAAGAKGIVSKAIPVAELVEALADVAAGRQVVTGRFYGVGSGAWPGSRWDLSSRESETLALLAIGMSNKTIGEALFISENTVRTHLKSVFRKLDVTSRSQAVAKALSDASFSTRHRQILDGEGPLKK